MIVFLYGKDAYRVKQNTDKIVGEYLIKHPKRMGALRADLAEENGFAQLEEAIKTVGLFAEKKLIVAKNVFTEAEKMQGLIKTWKLVEDKERIVVVVENSSETELKKASAKLLALLIAKPNVAKEFKPLAGKQLESWLGKEAEALAVSIERVAVSQLISRVGNDAWRLRLELEKLAHYALAGGEKIVTLAHLDLLVAKPIEQNIFNTIDALGARDKGKAITLLARHLAEGEDPFYLFSMFVYQFRNLLNVKNANGQAPVGMHPYVAKKMAEQACKFELAELKQKFSQLAEADISIKNGQLDIIDCLYQIALS